MKILGIDPGTTRVGYGVVVVQKGTHTPKEYGCLNFEHVDPVKRLLFLGKEMDSLLSNIQPDRVALEAVFFSKNKKTALTVSEARGVIKFLVLRHAIHLSEYTPTQVKQAISTHGTASKQEVQKMVCLLLGLTHPPSPDDVTDALAVALCDASFAWQKEAGLDP